MQIRSRLVLSGTNDPNAGESTQSRLGAQFPTSYSWIPSLVCAQVTIPKRDPYLAMVGSSHSEDLHAHALCCSTVLEGQLKLSRVDHFDTQNRAGLKVQWELTETCRRL